MLSVLNGHRAHFIVLILFFMLLLCDSFVHVNFNNFPKNSADVNQIELNYFLKNTLLLKNTLRLGFGQMPWITKLGIPRNGLKNGLLLFIHLKRINVNHPPSLF